MQSEVRNLAVGFSLAVSWALTAAPTSGQSTAVRNVGDPGVSVDALVGRGVEALPTLSAMLDGGPAERARACAALRRLGPVAEDIVPRIIQLLRTGDPKQAPALYEALAELIPLDRPAPVGVPDAVHRVTESLLKRADPATGMAIRRGFVRVLIRSWRARDALLHGSANVIEQIRENTAITREFAAELAGLSGQPMEKALPVLLEALAREPEPRDGGTHGAFGARFVARDQFLMKAAWAVERIRGERFEHVHRHRYYLRYGSPAEQIEAASSLGRGLRQAAHAVPALVEALEDSNPRVVAEAVTALGMLGERSRDAVPAIEALQKSEDRQIAVRARAALRQLR